MRLTLTSEKATIVLEQWSTPDNIRPSIEKISDIASKKKEELLKLSERIRPAIITEKRVETDDCDIIVERLWKVDKDLGLNEICCQNYLTPSTEIPEPFLLRRCVTLHTLNGHRDYNRPFKPTIGDVLSQIPEEIKRYPGDVYFTTKNLARSKFGTDQLYDGSLTSFFGTPQPKA